jgi:hypothetical protein
MRRGILLINMYWLIQSCIERWEDLHVVCWWLHVWELVVLGGASRSISRWEIHVSDVYDLVLLLLRFVVIVYISRAHTVLVL